jgi:hypothetical protein
VAVVGAAALGDRASGVAGPEPSAESAVSTTSAAASAAVPDAALRLDRPARRDEVVRTREIVVRGHVALGIAQVWVSLESGGRPIATKSIDPTGMPRGNLVPFETRFTVDRPRPAGPLFVTVVAVGSDGVPIDALRRRFSLGEWLELRGPITNRPWSGAARRLGEDGYMGGIPFGTNVPPRPGMPTD